MEMRKENEEVREWKLIRNIVIPESIPSESDGVNWERKENGGFLFAFDTDENGNSFSTNEVACNYKAGFMADDTLYGGPVISFHNMPTYGGTNGVAIPCSFGKKGAFAAGWFKIEKISDRVISYGGYSGGGSFCNMQSGINLNTIYDSPIKAMGIYLLNNKQHGLMPGSEFTFYGR